MKQLAAIVLYFAVCSSFAFAQTGTNADPNRVKFVTSDIDDFWRAFDSAAEETDREKKISTHETDWKK